MHTEPKSDCKYILSVDIGIIHFALVLLECDLEYTYKDIIWFDLIDITRFQHLDERSKQDCKLYHSKTMTDWISHVTYLHAEVFELAEFIVIERQPPQGHTALEQLLFHQFRSKAVLVSPRSVHAFFGWSTETDYLKRKEKSTAILEYRLQSTNRTWLLTELAQLSRQHDVADAFVQALFFLNLKHTEWRQSRTTDAYQFLDNFRYFLYIQ